MKRFLSILMTLTLPASVLAQSDMPIRDNDVAMKYLIVQNLVTWAEGDIFKMAIQAYDVSRGEWLYGEVLAFNLKNKAESKVADLCEAYARQTLVENLTPDTLQSETKHKFYFVKKAGKTYCGLIKPESKKK